MPDAGFQITGIEECQELLEKAPKNIVMLGYGRAANAAINVIAAELVTKTPIRVSESEGNLSGGDLVKHLVTDVTVDADSRGVTAAVGFGSQGQVANWLEYGHRMVTHAGKQVGDVPAQPFVRPAFDASADAAIEAFAVSLEGTLAVEYESKVA